jgi:hypothetical protein
MKLGSVAGTILIAGLAVLGCGGGGGAAAPSGSASTAVPSGSPSAGTPVPSQSAPSALPLPSASSGGSPTIVRVYLLRDEKVSPAARSVTGTGVARAAMEALLAGPTAGERAGGLTSSIPVGSGLLGVAIDAGTATVDLSSTYASGGGSLSMMSRIAQVVYTLTQFPTVQRVAFSIDGAPATAIGGEGVIVDHPQTRADWESFAPAILVESPLPGQTVTSPFHATGSADTFEARYGYRLRGADDSVLAEGRGSATSGTGTRGTFDQAVSYGDASGGGTGTLELFELSAKDGSEINLVSVPVELR